MPLPSPWCTRRLHRPSPHPLPKIIRQRVLSLGHHQRAPLSHQVSRCWQVLARKTDRRQSCPQTDRCPQTRCWPSCWVLLAERVVRCDKNRAKNSMTALRQAGHRHRRHRILCECKPRVHRRATATSLRVQNCASRLGRIQIVRPKT